MMVRVHQTTEKVGAFLLLQTHWKLGPKYLESNRRIGVILSLHILRPLISLFHLMRRDR